LRTGINNVSDDAPAGGQQGDNDRPVDTRPFLCVPYWSSPRFVGDSPDDGMLRPLPGDVVSWLCPAIHAGPYSPGQPLTVTVDVVNSGSGNATSLVSVVVYWADATVGFAKPTMLGAAVVAVPPRGGRGVSSGITGTIPKTASEHICLLAVATHPLDPAGAIADPVNNRHWAQRNLTAVKVTPVQPAVVKLNVVNPLATEAVFVMETRTVARDLLGAIARDLRAEPAREALLRIKPLDRVRGRDVANDVIGDPIGLEAGARLTFHVAVHLASELGQGEFTASEVTLRRLDDDRRTVVGSLGIVATSA
jgi:hypothetical protein